MRAVSVGGGDVRIEGRAEDAQEEEVYPENSFAEVLDFCRFRGLDLAELDPALLAEARPAFDAALASGNLIRTPSGRLRIPSDRFFISDFAIISEIL